jgi:hypothetical protein
MANVTAKGITFPTQSDNIAPLESILAIIANGADQVGIVSGRFSIPARPDATGGTVGISVTFDYALESAPVVTGTIQAGAGASSYIITIVDTSTTGFNAKAYRLNGSGADSTLVLHWMASDYNRS